MIESSTRIAGRYRVDARLGGGGMADVFEAHDEQLGRPVAIKLLRGIDDAGAARRFAEEIRLTARVNHPNIVALYDAGEHEGSPYLILERVTGGTLAGEMADGPMEPRRVAALGEQLASALSHSHAAGIVHRDVKPTNVLLTDDGSVRLADFGIAVTATATRLTVAGTIAGSAGYVSPEQVLGSGAAAPSDIYALGLVLLECLTGAPPWSGTTVEVALARISADPDIPSDLPDGWQPLLAGMTARNPEDRPHIDLVGHALSRLAADEPYDTSLVAPPPPPPDRRIPAVAGMSMLVLLLTALMVLTTDATPDVAIAEAAPPVNVPAANALLEPAVALSSAPVPDWVIRTPRVAEQAQPARERSDRKSGKASAKSRTRNTAAGNGASAPATTSSTSSTSSRPRVAASTAPAPSVRPTADRTATTTKKRSTSPKRERTTNDTTKTATRDVTDRKLSTTQPDSDAVKVSTNTTKTGDKEELTKRQLKKRRAKLRAAALEKRLEDTGFARQSKSARK